MPAHVAFASASLVSTCCMSRLGPLHIAQPCMSNTPYKYFPGSSELRLDRRTKSTAGRVWHSSLYDTPSQSNGRPDRNSDEEEEAFLKRELARLESLQELVQELEHDVVLQDDADEDNETWLELFGMLPEEADPEDLAEMEKFLNDYENVDKKSAATLERALLQGVVPAEAGVGSRCLPGDFGFDPLNLSTNDHIGRLQRSALDLLPERDPEEVMFQTLTNTTFTAATTDRPNALILRDYREAEIRHGRLAMLAAFFWPLQEMLDRYVLDQSQFGSLLYGHVTLPYIPLFLTATMLLLGYLDIYSKAIKDVEDLGDAYLPGDCFWDPLSVLQGAPDSMKRNMQERELFNGRVAMLAFAVFVFEEATTGLPVISIPSNDLLFEPVYQIPFIQEYLDSIFETQSSTFTFPDVGKVDFVGTLRELEAEELQQTTPN